MKWFLKFFLFFFKRIFKKVTPASNMITVNKHITDKTQIKVYYLFVVNTMSAYSLLWELCLWFFHAWKWYWTSIVQTRWITKEMDFRTIATMKLNGIIIVLCRLRLFSKVNMKNHLVVIGIIFSVAYHNIV